MIRILPLPIYIATDSEALAVIEAVRAYDPNVYGRRFIVYTDHRPLVYVFTRKNKVQGCCIGLLTYIKTFI